MAMHIENLLLASVAGGAAAAAVGAGAGGEPSRRLCAAQWARQLFAFDHVPAR